MYQLKSVFNSSVDSLSQGCGILNGPLTLVMGGLTDVIKREINSSMLRFKLKAIKDANAE